MGSKGPNDPRRTARYCACANELGLGCTPEDIAASALRAAARPPKPAEPQSGVRRTVKLLPGAEALAKPLPRKRAAPTSTRARSVLKPLKTLQSHLSGVLGLPKPAPNLL